MRARSIRLTLVVLVILGLAVASLAFREINLYIPGVTEFKRGADGPLGLKLGLDLRGGGHLVYQADTGTHLDLVFDEAVEAKDINLALADLDISVSTEPRSPTSYRVRAPLLSGDQREQARRTLESEVGSLNSFRVTDITDPTPDQMEGVLDTISRRINLFGTEEPIVQRFGDDRIIVQLPGASGSITQLSFTEPVEGEELGVVLSGMDLGDVSYEQLDDQSFTVTSDNLGADRRAALLNALESRFGSLASFGVKSGIDEAKRLIGQTARLEFKRRTCADSFCNVFDDSDIGLTGDQLENAFAAQDNRGTGWVINIQFDDEGSQRFSDLTRAIAGVDTERIAVFMDGEELLAPVARNWIRDGRSEISGSSLDPFTREEARTLSIQLESGRLQVPLRLIQENDVKALLGEESLQASLLAGLIGLALVVVFMLVYYRMAGLVAAMALVFYSLILLAVFKLVPITLTLSHIGGFILSIGMAVDANILIFERMKEEVRIGRTLASSMEVGFNRAWPAIRDGNFSTLITCGVLIWFGDRLGGGLITGFAISLGIGVLISMFTAVVVSRNLLQLLAWVGLRDRVSLFTPGPAQRAAGGGG
jgi:preprotein translocase subunit SecD